MPQVKKYVTSAARQKAYRERNEIKDMRRKRKCGNIERLKLWLETNDRSPRDPAKLKIYTNNYRKRQRMKIPFIAFDGEGKTTKQIAAHQNGNPIYKQLYVLLTASDGQYIEDWKNGLKTTDCLDFLLRYAGENYCVGFGIGYDVTKMLCDLEPEAITWLWEYGEIFWEGYYLKYIPNKIFVVKRDDKQITLFDSFGFFQKPFIKSLKDWGIECPQEVIDGKEQRGNFQDKDKAKIRKYNLIECQLLVELMDKLRNAAYEANFLPTQWYGAGAIASYMLEINGIKYHTASPERMIPFFLNAYYGGRNQVLKMGEFDKSIWLHDINSAYPAAMKSLPSAIGEWYETEAIMWNWPWCLYEIEWNLPKDTLITPFPVRKKDKSIHWPLRGSGWYWQPEVWEATKYYPQYIKIKRAFCFDPAVPDDKPFEFIGEYYEKRKEFLAQGNDAQLVLKLGINACYGKLAQSVGKHGSKPPYQDFFLSGFITSRTRASVFSLAMECPNKIIAFSTDGIASQVKLVDNDDEKSLGGWEVKQVDDYFILQSGVYTYRDNDETRFKSRGFSHKSVDYDELRKLWQRDGVLGVYDYKENRFMGIGNGLRQNFDLIGNWFEQERQIVFAPTSMEYGKWDRKLSYLQLTPPQYVGDSFAYEMKVNWLEHQADFDSVDNDLQSAL